MNLHTICNGFEFIEEKYIEEVGGKGRIFEHLKSGARLIQIENEDSNKAFTISFKTPPADNTGVAHIIEHAICCASEKYPLKDTFIELDKGSLNTSLNACTYKDMTMYYCSSKHDKDYMNLIEVIMDLVFHPLIATRPYIFKQEGWHYSLENEKEEITYNGIVYNEMQGEYGEPSTILDYELHKALFPDTVYRYDSGGIPQEIVKLSYESFIAFYEAYYHPSNCTIYCYGDGNLIQQLALLDECLKGFEKRVMNYNIPLQQCCEKPKSIRVDYPTTHIKKLNEQGIFALGFVIGEAIDGELRLAFQILEHLLLKSAASPLNALLVGEKEIGKVLEESGYDMSKQQPTFSIVLNGAYSKKENDFEQTIWECLNQLVIKGIDQNLLEAAIHTVTFGLKEAEIVGEPKGILYSEDIQMSSLYGGHPLEHLSYMKHLKIINEKKDKGYFEELIRKYLVENNHRVKVIMVPCSKLNNHEQKSVAKQLRNYKKTLNKQEIKSLIAMNLELDTLQEDENSPEELALLPTLSLEDLPIEIAPTILKESMIENVKILFNAQQTKGIVYLDLLFDTRSILQEDIPYIGVLTYLLTYLSTKHYSYWQLENEINKQSGGINCSINAYEDCENIESYKPLFKISCKVLMDKIPVLMELLHEIVTEGLFTEKEKMKEIISYIKYEMERSLTSCPEYRATRKVYAYFLPTGVYEDLVSGMEQYTFLNEIEEHFERDFNDLSCKLTNIYHKIMQKNHLMINITGQEQYYAELTQHISSFLKDLPNKYYEEQQYRLTPCVKKEAYITSNSVQAIANAFNFKKLGYSFKGSFYVIAHLLNNTYLWDKVRLQGGAYGCDVTVSREGNLVLCSHCDPDIGKTLEAYQGIAKFLREICLEENELEKYKIGTIGGLEIPITMEQQSERDLIYYLCHITPEMIKKEREEILATNQQDIVKMSELFELLSEQQGLCVIGNQAIIESHQKLFDEMIAIC